LHSLRPAVINVVGELWPRHYGVPSLLFQGFLWPVCLKCSDLAETLLNLFHVVHSILFEAFDFLLVVIVGVALLLKTSGPFLQEREVTKNLLLLLCGHVIETVIACLHALNHFHESIELEVESLDLGRQVKLLSTFLVELVDSLVDGLEVFEDIGSAVNDL
jgi:hypothetical protein